MRFLLALILLTACTGETSTPAAALAVDRDGDGVPQGEDCNDHEAGVYPGAVETCDGVDQDCDSLVDNEALDAELWLLDGDQDGYGEDGTGVWSCSQLVGRTTTGGDCDDRDEAVHPGAQELCDGETDEDCDGLVDDEDPEVIGGEDWVPDADGDGFGDASAEALSFCADPSTAELAWVQEASDCDDTRADVHPGAGEVCDALDTDEDCDGLVEDADPGVSPDSRDWWFPDRDEDGFGDGGSGVLRCDPPGAAPAWLADDTDCDDTSVAAAVTWPGAAWLDSATACMKDGDGDGYGDEAPARAAVEPGSDCDDADPGINLDGQEVCDAANVDEDCDGRSDNADDSVDPTTQSSWYRDQDADGHGASGATVRSACDDPSTSSLAFSTTTDDCDDLDAGVSPSATEVCDEDDTDEDCSGLSEDDDPGLDLSSRLSWYPDGDADGYGDPGGVVVAACEDPGAAGAAYSLDDSDCDDGEAETWPGADEACDDGVDSDCDGLDDTCQYLEDTEAWLTIEGSEQGALLGYAVASGDLDGDGTADLVLGAVGSSAGGSASGAAYAYLGVGSGTATGLELTGVDDDDHAGISLWAGDDLDGDGLGDLVVGAYSADPEGVATGAVYLLAGPLTAGRDLGEAEAVVSGEAAGDYAGFRLWGGGDLDGDGVDDLLVTALLADGADADQGAVYLLSGPVTGDLSLGAAASSWSGEARGDRLGSSVSAGGDVDGDGVGDLILGAWSADVPYTNAGAAYLVLGPVTASMALSSAQATLTGEGSNAQAGSAVDIGGDLDGDGLADLVVGTRTADLGSATGNGGAYVLFGLPTGSLDLGLAADLVVVGEAKGDDTAFSLDAHHDYDGDGVSDLLLGASGNDSGASEGGRVFVILGGSRSGSLELPGEDGVITGTTADTHLGGWVSGVEDLDGDGLDEVFVGASGDDTVDTDAGAGLLFGGATLGF